MTREIVIDALRMAWFKRHPSKQAGLIFHSDRGSQYASQDFRDVLTEYGITASMSRRGNCWDTACSETLFGSLKAERLHVLLEFPALVIGALLARCGGRPQWHRATRPRVL